MKPATKVVGIGCLSIVGLFALLMIGYGIHRALETPAERAAEDKKIADADAARQKERDKKEADARAAEELEKEKVRRARQENGRPATEELVHKLTLLRRQLPRLKDLVEKPCPASMKGEQITYLPADYIFISQFGEAGFQPQENLDPHMWYRAVVLDQAQKALTAGKTPADWDTPTLASVSATFDSESYIVVFLSLSESWPKLMGDNKSFVSGYFRGWEILVDAKKLEPQCQTLFEATNSAKVTDHYLALGPHDDEHSIKIGANMGKAIADDFTNNFWSAANEAIGRMRKKGETP
jgi:hypothetical protein